MFNWLRPVINGASCLDLFAGSGALGFEAASRGAGEVLLVEKNRQVVHILNSQVSMVKAENISVLQADALQWLPRAQQSYDVIFLDPPFDLDLIPQCCELILQHQLLAQNGRLYIESSRSDLANELPAGLRMLKSSRAGQVYYALAAHADPLELK